MTLHHLAIFTDGVQLEEKLSPASQQPRLDLLHQAGLWRRDGAAGGWGEAVRGIDRARRLYHVISISDEFQSTMATRHPFAVHTFYWSALINRACRPIRGSVPPARLARWRGARDRVLGSSLALNLDSKYPNPRVICTGYVVPAVWSTQGRPGGQGWRKCETILSLASDETDPFSCFFINTSGPTLHRTPVPPIQHNACQTFHPLSLGLDPRQRHCQSKNNR